VCRQAFRQGQVIGSKALKALIDAKRKFQAIGWVCVCCQGALQDVSDFLLHGQTVSRSTQAQAGFELVVEIANGDAAHDALPKNDCSDCSDCIVIIWMF
jgi:hypothetical protein